MSADADSFEVVVATPGGAISVKPHQVSVPDNDWKASRWNTARQVWLRVGTQRAVFEVVRRPGGSGRQIVIAAGQLGLTGAQPQPVTISPATRVSLDWRLLADTGYGRVLMFGLAIGLSGIAIDVALEAGKRGYVWIALGDAGLFGWYAASQVLKAVGLLLTFLTATFYKKE